MKKSLLKTLLVVALIALCFPMKVRASEERDMWKVVEGTAIKVGETEETAEVVKGGGFIEEWEANPAKIEALTAETTDKLLKAENLKELPITVEEISYDILKRLAEEAAEKEKVKSVYQGYAQIELSEAKNGYTFGGTITEVEGQKIWTGYYANSKVIYRLRLVVLKTNWADISPKVVTTESYNSAPDYKPETKPGPKPPKPNPPKPDDPEPDEPEPEPDDPIDVPDDPIIPLPTT